MSKRSTQRAKAAKERGAASPETKKAEAVEIKGQAESAPEAKKEKKPVGKAKTRAKSGKLFFLDSSGVPTLVAKIILMFLGTWGYVFLCGFIFDYYLKWYHMVNFILYSTLTLFAASVALSVVLTVRYVKYGKKRRR